MGVIVFDGDMTAEPAVSDDYFREILNQTRQFVRSAVVPRESEIAENDAIPDDLREQAKQMGLFGYAIPQEWGGLGLDITQDVEMALELGYTSLALARSLLGMSITRIFRCWSVSAPMTRNPAGWPTSPAAQ